MHLRSVGGQVCGTLGPSCSVVHPGRGSPRLSTDATMRRTSSAACRVVAFSLQADQQVLNLWHVARRACDAPLR